MIQFKNKNCLDYLKTLEGESVDLVLTDPPYFIGFDGGKGWDSQWKSEDEYLDWCREWTEECARVLKPERMMVIWGTLKTDTFLRHKLEILNKIPGLYSQNEIVWSYNWGGRQKKNFARKHEYAWCYSKEKEFLFNADDVRIERILKSDIRKSKELGDDFIDKYGETHVDLWGEPIDTPSKSEIKKHREEVVNEVAFEKGTIPTCVWEKNNHTTSKDFCGWHPTTKNVELLERIIKAYTNPGDTVLDIFMGSGSTMIALSLIHI